MEDEDVRRRVRDGYDKIAREGLCCSSTTSCCDSSTASEALEKVKGYTEEELTSIPQGSNLGLGCGNPVALASLREGETVIDLGSGGGVDCFLAGKRVGESGKVIGVDMTPAMIDRARENAQKSRSQNVEFRLGEIENLPVADNTANVVISNCVINLTPNKKRVFEEAFRVLKPGGRLMVSDIVLLKELPEAIKKRAHPTSCIQSAVLKDEYMKSIEAAGFQNVTIIEEKQHSFEDVIDNPNARVVVADKKRSGQELKNIAELDAETREIVKEALTSTSSVNISAKKPS